MTDLTEQVRPFISDRRAEYEEFMEMVHSFVQELKLMLPITGNHSMYVCENHPRNVRFSNNIMLSLDMWLTPVRLAQIRFTEPDVASIYPVYIDTFYGPAQEARALNDAKTVLYETFQIHALTMVDGIPVYAPDLINDVVANLLGHLGYLISASYNHHIRFKHGELMTSGCFANIDLKTCDSLIMAQQGKHYNLKIGGYEPDNCDVEPSVSYENQYDRRMKKEYEFHTPYEFHISDARAKHIEAMFQTMRQKSEITEMLYADLEGTLPIIPILTSDIKEDVHKLVTELLTKTPFSQTNNTNQPEVPNKQSQEDTLELETQTLNQAARLFNRCMANFWNKAITTYKTYVAKKSK